jgi:hypothetical protein
LKVAKHSSLQPRESGREVGGRKQKQVVIWLRIINTFIFITIRKASRCYCFTVQANGKRIEMQQLKLTFHSSKRRVNYKFKSTVVTLIHCHSNLRQTEQWLLSVLFSFWT